MNTIVIGGGISGLAAAWELMRQGHEVTLLESAASPGGKLQTGLLHDTQVELGPDSYLRRNPVANELLDSLDLVEITPSASSALLFTLAGLQPIPTGLNLGAPRAPRQALANHLVGLGDRLRAAVGTILPPKDQESDDLGKIVAHRYGRRWSDTTIEPLVGGINANTIYGLSARTSAPSIVEMRPQHTSTSSSSGPLFATPQGGLSTLVQRLISVLEATGCKLFSSTPVTSLEQGAQGDFWVTSGSETFRADRILIALPAHQSAALLDPLLGDDAELLRGIHYASVSMLIAATDEDLPPHLANLSGVLVARDLGLMTTAVSLASNKWPAWIKRPGTLIRVSTGSLYDRRHLRMDDHKLRDNLLIESERILGQPIEPSWTELVRWPYSFPHFRPYHAQLIAKIDAAISRRTHGNIALTGSWVSGSGIPTCIATARIRSRQLTNDL